MNQQKPSLTRIQKKKAQYLAEKGGKITTATVHIGMPDGSIASIDPFGRTTWDRRAEVVNKG